MPPPLAQAAWTRASRWRGRCCGRWWAGRCACRVAPHTSFPRRRPPLPPPLAAPSVAAPVSALRRRSPPPPQLTRRRRWVPLCPQFLPAIALPPPLGVWLPCPFIFHPSSLQSTALRVSLSFSDDCRHLVSVLCKVERCTGCQRCCQQPASPRHHVLRVVAVVWAAQSSVSEGAHKQGGLVSQAFTALSARRGGALGQSLSRLEPQVRTPLPLCSAGHVTATPPPLLSPFPPHTSRLRSDHDSRCSCEHNQRDRGKTHRHEC